MKTCKTCEFYFQRVTICTVDGWDVTKHETGGKCFAISKKTGEQYGKYCTTMRTDGAECGPSGKLYKKRRRKICDSCDGNGRFRRNKIPFPISLFFRPSYFFQKCDECIDGVNDSVGYYIA